MRGLCSIWHNPWVTLVALTVDLGCLTVRPVLGARRQMHREQAICCLVLYVHGDDPLSWWVNSASLACTCVICIVRFMLRSHETRINVHALEAKNRLGLGCSTAYSCHSECKVDIAKHSGRTGLTSVHACLLCMGKLHHDASVLCSVVSVRSKCLGSSNDTALQS